MEWKLMRHGVREQLISTVSECAICFLQKGLLAGNILGCVDYTDVRGVTRACPGFANVA